MIGLRSDLIGVLSVRPESAASFQRPYEGQTRAESDCRAKPGNGKSLGRVEDGVEIGIPRSR